MSPQTPPFSQRSVRDVPIEPTRHGGQKKVLLRHEEVHSHLMFLNEVYVASGETITAHRHEDMEEVFYFLDGEGRMHIEEDHVSVEPGDRVFVPARVTHLVTNTGPQLLRFICFGIKVQPEDV